MASIQYVVSATDAASGVFKKIALSADSLDRQLADLSKRVATPEVNLKDALKGNQNAEFMRREGANDVGAAAHQVHHDVKVTNQVRR